MKTDSPKNVITVEPVDLIWKVHVSYEHVFNNKNSMGIGAHYFHSDLIFDSPEFKIDLFYRYYYKKSFFIQPMLSGGELFAYTKAITGGGSLSWGYKKVFPRSHITLDASIGLQVYPYYFSGADLEAFSWYFFGDGSILIPRFAIGYAF